ncbi:carboxypeptidase Q-like [Orbicella faveolata]|uniref:carboxypeptidase Q-like n=2 Tax=Orbicella faveolata TaxID=48498 RepID=UPI0009E1A301|nr:carboxypeptidase Q-like [Orbicella faveolata]XP_020601904.1 carboxypeptidase Q-like [Orbicella faveolata]XP_020601905.1 carboxypeptidase Q-like [Orbicella faveolata]
MDLKTFPLCLACLCSALFTLASVTSADKDSHLSYQLKKEIVNHQDDANKIIDFLTKGPGKQQVYNRLATFVDTYGSRIAGSANLERAIDYMLDELDKDKLDNVHGEEVQVTHWVRGEESARMLLPRNYSIALLGLGGSVGTPPDGITAEVLVVRSFDELHDQASKAKGKIVVFNERWVDYETSVIYRTHGAAEVAKVGGVASLIRSVTPFSIYSPHTGWQDYEQGVEKIPTACITVEDAEMMARMAARGTKIVINLKMAAKTLPPAVSRNTVAEIKGSVYPEQVVLVSGHLDSWDVGQGAMDDGGGAFISWQALSVIRQLNLKPKRTMRMVLWTGEEEGLLGAEQYYNRHKENASNFSLVMESDIGTFMPEGISFTGGEKAVAIMREVMSLLKPINVTNLRVENVGGDITFWVRDGVPGGVLDNANSKYFYFHHSNGDTMTVQDPDAMDLCAAVWAVVAYTVADLDELLPRD